MMPSANGTADRVGERMLDIRGLKTYFATDDGMVQAVDGVELPGAERHEVAALPQDLTGDDAARRHGDQLQHRQRGDGLAATRLADDADRLATADGDIDAVHGLHHAFVGGKMRL